ACGQPSLETRRTRAGTGHGAEPCSGTTASCPNDTTFPSSTVTCRASTGQCDVAENCTGGSNACPTDSFKSSTVSCTGSSQSGLCDNDAGDHCLGTADTCVDTFKASTVTCRASTGTCDIAETCTGTNGSCP